MPKIDYLENWQVLNTYIMELDEDTLWDLIQAERRGNQRLQFILRLYGRFNTLRCIRERQELITFEVNK